MCLETGVPENRGPEELVVIRDASTTGKIGLEVQIEVFEAATYAEVLGQLVSHERIRFEEGTAVVPEVQGEYEQGHLPT